MRHPACDYFIENQFNEMLRRENYSDTDFSLLHLNIRSLPHNLVKPDLLSIILKDKIVCNRNF